MVRTHIYWLSVDEYIIMANNKVDVKYNDNSNKTYTRTKIYFEQ